MAKLPTEQDLGELPDRLPRRMGVGAWQPQDIERGTQQFGQGLERLGSDVGTLAGQQVRMQNEADVAKASSQLAVDQINTSQQMQSEADPTKISLYKNAYSSNVNDAASLIKDPDIQAKFRMQEAPKLAQYHVGADQHAQGLVNNQAIADTETSNTGLMNSALATDDPDDPRRAQNIGLAKQNIQSLVSRNIITPEKGVEAWQQFQGTYASSWMNSEIERANRTGDTSRLQHLGSLFKFNPGEWGAGAPGGVDPAHIAKGTLATNQDQAYQAARGEGLSDTAARAVVANLSGESLATPEDNHWDGSHMSQGIASWDPTRTAAIKAQFGKEPKDMSVADQTRAHIWEINNNPAFAETKAALAGSDPNAMVSALVGNYEKPANPASDIANRMGFYQGYGARVGGGGAAGGTTPRAIGDSLAVGVGGVTGAADALHGMNPKQVLSVIQGHDVANQFGSVKGATDADLKSGPIVLSSGASNNPSDTGTVSAQLAALKARGVDLSQVTVLGVGTRSDFQQLGVNTTLQRLATQNGAKFLPLDAGMIGPDGVHPIAAGYRGIAQQVGGAAAPTSGAFAGLPPPGATGANPHLAPPQSQWPAGARDVAHNPDGSLSYVMEDGTHAQIPGTHASGAYGAPSPGNTGTLLDALKPQERAELGLRIQNEIGTIQRQSQAQDNQYAAAATKDMGARVEHMVAGYPLGPNEAAALQSYGKSPIPEVRQSYATMMAVRDNLAGYQGRSPAEVGADVAAKEAAFNSAREADPNNPAIPMMAAILKASQDYAKTAATESVKQPLERAAKTGQLPNGIAPIDPTDPNVGAALTRRVSDAHTAAAALGVPIRYFQDSERPALRAVAKQGGDAMVNLATNIVKAGGADAPAMFKEIGVDAPAFQKIGEIAASPSGGDPQAIRDMASVINARNDKTANRDLPTFTDKMLSKFVDPMEGAAGRFGPDFTGRTRAAANMLMTAGAERDGWDPKTDPNSPNLNQQFFDRAYHLATGGTIAPDGTKYGGIVDRNAHNWTGAADHVMVPNTIKTDDFSKVINSITDATLQTLPDKPMGGNGIPISANQIHNGQLQAVPDKDGIFRGKYAVHLPTTNPSDDGMVRNSSGKLWALDLAQPQMDAALRGLNPNSFLAPRAAAPAPGRYRETPGQIALSTEAETP